jgi:hypothetical protein
VHQLVNKKTLMEKTLIRFLSVVNSNFWRTPTELGLSGNHQSLNLGQNIMLRISYMYKTHTPWSRKCIPDLSCNNMHYISVPVHEHDVFPAP